MNYPTTVEGAKAWIGKTVKWSPSPGNISMLFYVSIIDVKWAWGTPRYLIKPLNGSGEGEAWVVFIGSEV